MKNMRIAVWFWALSALSLWGCRPTPAEQPAAYIRLDGQTMGTYYTVTYSDSLNRNFQKEIDSLLLALNLEVSTYIDSATISLFNQADSLFEVPAASSGAGAEEASHFIRNFRIGAAIAQETNGALDPTVMPLVNYWGFGYAEKQAVTGVDSLVIDSLMQYVGMEKVSLIRSDNGYLMRKAAPGVQLDFSAVAKGYGVDLVGQLLERRGVHNYLVDIGGEARARGQSPRGDAWLLGINVPREDAALNEIQTALPLQDQSIATSGNYRNFYEVNGVKYSHTINPATGFPERNTLLSASVITRDCATADGYATAFMVMGLEKALQLAGQTPGLEAYFIYGLPDGGMGVYFTDGLKELLSEEEQ